MVMAKPFTYTYLLTASPSTEDEAEIATIGGARKFTAKSITIYWPSGCNFELQIRLMKGIYQFAPGNGYYASDGRTTRDVCEEVFQSGERIIVHYKNTNASTTYKALIQISGLLE